MMVRSNGLSTGALLVASALLVLVIVIGTRPSAGAPHTGCETIADGVIVETSDFTSPDDMLSQLPEMPLWPTVVQTEPLAPADVLVPGNVLDGLSLQGWTGNDDGAMSQYFLGRALSADVTTWTFSAEGGILIDRTPSKGRSFADELATVAGARAVRVDVGPYHATLTWADPLPNGVRTHNLYWTDGKYNFSLIANRSAATIVNLARGVVCGMPAA